MEGGLINPLALIRTGAAKGVTSLAYAHKQEPLHDVVDNTYLAGFLHDQLNEKNVLNATIIKRLADLSGTLHDTASTQVESGNSVQQSSTDKRRYVSA